MSARHFVKTCPGCRRNLDSGEMVYECRVCGAECCTVCSDTTAKHDVVCDDCLAAGYRDGWSQGRGDDNAGGARHFVKMFKPRFAPLVESGAKCRTIRPVPARMPRPGDTISLREWTGKPYRSKQRVLRESVITSGEPIQISIGWIRVGDRPALIGAGRDMFARADGFADFAEMRDFFRAEHGLPFTGILILWK